MLARIEMLRWALDPAEMMRASGVEPDAWQIEAVRSTSPRMLLLAARQVGKSTTTAVLGLHTALFEEDSLVLLLSPTQRQSGLLFDKVTRLYADLGRPVPAIGETATTLILENRSRIVSLPGTHATIRGYSRPRLLVVDEAAQAEDALFPALSPMLAASPGGRMVWLTTPYGQRGEFHRAWSDESDLWHRIKATAADCPRISAEFLAAERLAIGHRAFSQEYECRFEATIDQVFTTESIDHAFTSPAEALFAAEALAE